MSECKHAEIFTHQGTRLCHLCLVEAKFGSTGTTGANNMKTKPIVFAQAFGLFLLCLGVAIAADMIVRLSNG